jgi:hypothetical protein
VNIPVHSAPPIHTCTRVHVYLCHLSTDNVWRPYTAVALFAWLRVSGIRSGPLFPALTRARSGVQFGAYVSANCYGGW